MKRIINLIKNISGLAVIMSLVMLSGCGKTGNDEGSGTSAGGPLTRSEYVGMVGDAFGFSFHESESDIFSDVNSSNANYDAIQAAAEWNVIDSNGEFKPDDSATLGFAIESAVRAIDVDLIERSGASINRDNLVDFYVNNIAGIDVSDLDKNVTAETADAILAYAKDYYNNIELPQVTEMELCEGVIESKGNIILNADGQTGTITVGTYNVGDIVYLDGSDGTLARSIKITSIDGNRFTFEDATLEETFNSLHVSGTFEGQILEVTTATSAGSAEYGRVLYEEMSSYGMSYTPDGSTDVNASDSEVIDLGVKPEIGSNYAKFTVPIACQPATTGSIGMGTDSDGNATSADYGYSGDATLTVAVKDIKTTVDYDHEWLRVWKPKKVEFKLHFTTEVIFDAKGSASTSIPLGDMVIGVWGPLNVKVSLVANIGVDGSVNITYTCKNVATARWEKGKGLSTDWDSDPSLTAEAEATLTAEATALAELRVGIWDAQYGIANVQATTGIVAIAKADIDYLGDQPDCLDIFAYVPLRWGVNQKGCAITDINSSWKKSGVIWDSENSPLTLHYHFEDGVRTPGDVCTRTENEVVTESHDENGEPYDEYKLFDFEPIEFDFVELVTYTMFIDMGEAGTIQIASIPEGYTESDLVYSSDDTTVCTVSGGKVNGIAAGSTLVRIGTSDGAYEVTLAVTVRDDYSIDGGFEDL